ncbi:MAG TPA: glycosyltransferase [Rhodanobacteraceae bacterium]|nr:glycosyltransferase [Rhodanobacteraceae bacterium]
MAADKRPLRILMILDNCYPALRGGGAESQVRTLALYLKNLGHRVTILTPRVPHGRQQSIERYEGVPVRRLEYPLVRGVASLVLWAKLIAFLWRRRKRYDAWHVHIVHHFGTIAVAMGDKVGVPVVAKFSGQWELQGGLLAEGGSPLMRYMRHLLRRASAYQAISQSIAATARERDLPADRIVVLPNAVDLRRFSVHERPLEPDRPLTFVYAGRLQVHKGLDTLITAWAKAFGPSSGHKLILAGAGEDESRLRALAESLGVIHTFEFTGFTNEIETVLARGDVAVLPSLIEGLSNTLLEYMSSGLPVIASRVSGSEDFVIPGRNGWLFPVRDVDALTACLKESATLPREELRRLGRQSRADVEARAGIANVVGRMLALYRGVAPREIGSAPAAMPVREGG